MAESPLIVAIIAGAAEFPGFGNGFERNSAFAASAEAFVEYLKDDSGLALRDDWILNLFDRPDGAQEQDERITAHLAKYSKSFQIVLFFYTGHGGFAPPNREFFLALKCTKKGKEQYTGLRITALAKTLGDWTLNKCLLLILDCCFAATAVQEFQDADALGDTIDAQTHQTLPPAGTALLVAASKDQPAVSPSGNRYTMFSDALLKTLRAGIPKGRSALTLREVGIKTESLITDQYGMEGVRPQVHSPRQTTGDAAETIVFPNPAWEGNPTDFHPNKPLDSPRSSQLVNIASKEDRKRLRELTFVHQLYDVLGNLTDPREILAIAETVFDEPKLLSKAEAERMLTEARTICASTERKHERNSWKSNFAWVAATLKPVLDSLPPDEDCVNEVFAYPADVCIPFLVSRFFRENSFMGKHAVADLIFKSGAKAPVLYVLEEIIRDGSFGQTAFAKAVDLGREIKGEQFEDWYLRLRERSHRDEQEDYQRCIRQREDERRRAVEQDVKSKRVRNLQQGVDLTIESLEGLRKQLQEFEKLCESVDRAIGSSSSVRLNFEDDEPTIVAAQTTLGSITNVMRKLREEFEVSMDQLHLRVDMPKSANHYVTIGDRVVIAPIPQRSLELPTGIVNWAPSMNKFCGRQATVTEVSNDGAPAVKIDIDLGKWWWSVKWLTVDQ